MKVAHVFWGLGYGGIETMLVNIANEQVKAGANVSIIVINDLMDKGLTKSFDDSIHIYCLRRKLHSHNLNFIFTFNKVLNEIDPDAIHLHASCFYALIFNRKLRRIASTTLHDLPSGMVRRGLLGKFFPILNFLLPGNVSCIDLIPKVFSISQAVHDELQERYGIESKVICNGIHTSMFEQRMIEPFKETMHIIQVSRLEHEKKGQDLLIEAVAKLKGKVTVDFIGEGKSFQFLKSLAEKLGIAEYVKFLGKRPQSYIATHLKCYDLFVQPSRYEGFGLTVAEAMSSCVPVLVSSGQGPAEVTCGYDFGWIFENGNIDDLVSKIEFISKHYAQAMTKVQLAFQHVIDNYDVSVTARKYLESY